MTVSNRDISSIQLFLQLFGNLKLGLRVITLSLSLSPSADTEDPVIGCLSDITVNSTAGQSNAIVSWTPPNATDNSGSYELTFNKAVGASFEIGSFEVIYIASDDAGNTDRCTFFVNVEGEKSLSMFS